MSQPIQMSRFELDNDADNHSTQPEAPVASESPASTAARRYNGRPLGGLRTYGLTDKDFIRE